MIMKFYIPGVPVEKRIQARVMISKTGKKFVSFYNPKLREQDAVRFLLRRTIYDNSRIGYGIYNTPIELKLLFNMPIPKSYTKRKLVQIADGDLQHVKRPDLANLIKFIEDCLVELVMIDDRQVINITASKRYAVDPGTVIIVETL